MTDTLIDKVNAAYRDFEVDGVPASGNHEPDKSEIRDLLRVMAEFSVGILINPPLADGEVLAHYTFPREVVFAADFEGSLATSITDPDGDITYSVERNGEEVGTIAYDGDFTFTTEDNEPVLFERGDVLSISGPSDPDESAACSITLVGS